MNRVSVTSEDGDGNLTVTVDIAGDEDRQELLDRAVAACYVALSPGRDAYPTAARGEAVPFVQGQSPPRGASDDPTDEMWDPETRMPYEPGFPATLAPPDPEDPDNPSPASGSDGPEVPTF